MFGELWNLCACLVPVGGLAQMAPPLLVPCRLTHKVTRRASARSLLTTRVGLLDDWRTWSKEIRLARTYSVSYPFLPESSYLDDPEATQNADGWLGLVLSGTG